MHWLRCMLPPCKRRLPVNSLDVFYLTKHLRDIGLDIGCTDEFLAQFATVALLDDCGYFVYFLESVGEDDSCIFLNESRCSVQAAKPMACRLYPFMVEPNKSGVFRYLYSREWEHHFCGPVVETRSWMKKYFQQEARTFMQTDFADTVPIARLLRSIPEHRKKKHSFTSTGSGTLNSIWTDHSWSSSSKTRDDCLQSSAEWQRK